MELPFLEELVREEKIPIIPIAEEIPERKIKPSVVKIDKRTSSIKGANKKGKKSKKEKPQKKAESVSSKKSVKVINGTGMYGLPDETQSRDKLHFKTEERTFSKSIKFNDPSIIVLPPKNDLTLLRDTFRSQIKVNIVYVQVQNYFNNFKITHAYNIAESTPKKGKEIQKK